MYINLRPQALQDWLRHELVECQKVLKEYDIIRAWQSLNWLPDNCLGSNLGMFRAHFFVFHQLYHFHCIILSENIGALDIHTLEIKFTSIESQKTSCAEHQFIDQIDALFAYYIDWKPLFETCEQQVQQLLQFAYAGITQPYRLQAALDRFEVSPPVSKKAVKQAYRKLAQQFHPDKGGSLEDIQQLNLDRALVFQWLEHQ